jgi:hypothetical protein
VGKQRESVKTRMEARTKNVSNASRKILTFLEMADEVVYKVMVLEEGHITVQAPMSVFTSEKKGYFTLFDAAAVMKGKFLFIVCFRALHYF